MSILFHEIIYGPVKSRRFGYSLGLNLLPSQSKRCTFNCIYCECGWNPEKASGSFATTDEFLMTLEKKLIALKNQNAMLDVLTFAGNGEPTLHPDFSIIVKETSNLRNKYFPGKSIVLLTNASTLTNTEIRDSLKWIDKPVLKLDSAIEETMRVINLPAPAFNFQQYMESLTTLPFRISVQTMLLRGKYQNQYIDNTTDTEITALMEQYKKINPMVVMLYSLDRIPPLSGLEKISSEEIKTIAQKMEHFQIAVNWV